MNSVRYKTKYRKIRGGVDEKRMRGFKIKGNHLASAACQGRRLYTGPGAGGEISLLLRLRSGSGKRQYGSGQTGKGPDSGGWPESGI